MDISTKTARRVSFGAIFAIVAGVGLEVLDAYSHEGIAPISQPAHLAGSAIQSPFAKVNPFSVVEKQAETDAEASMSNAWVKTANQLDPWRVKNAKENLQWVRDTNIYGVQSYEYLMSAYDFLDKNFRNADLVGLTPEQFANMMREHSQYAAREMLQKILAQPAPGTPESILLYSNFERAALYAGIQPDGGAIRYGTYESIGVTSERVQEMAADNYFVSAQNSLAEMRTLAQSSNPNRDDYSRAYENLVSGIIYGAKEGRTEADIRAVLGLTADQLVALQFPPSIKNNFREGAPAP